MENIFLAVAAVIVLALAGCSSPPSNQNIGGTTETMRSDVLAGANTAAKGDVVHVDYIGKLENGTVFDTSLETEAKNAGLPPRSSYAQLTFTLGAGQMIKGFDDAVVGMREGEAKTVTLPPELAYGNREDRNVIVFPIGKIGNAESLKVGSALYAANGAIGTVLEINSENVTVDFNHELAGKTLIFTIKLARVDKKY